MNVFTSLDIAANSLVASYMGRGDRLEAQRLLRRILALGVFAGACMATLMVGGAEVAPAGFTTDRGVRAAASRVFPLLGLLLVRCCRGADIIAPGGALAALCVQVTEASASTDALACAKYECCSRHAWMSANMVPRFANACGERCCHVRCKLPLRTI